MTIEEIKAEIEKKIEECSKYIEDESYGEESRGEVSAYEDALRLLNNWNGIRNWGRLNDF
jgi:hypothetical protein